MTTSTVNLVVKVPELLRRQARAAAVMRGETISEVVRYALAQYIEQAEKEDDLRYADTVLKRIAKGAPMVSHEEVWEEIDQLEAAGELPD